jgi:hypothetical protein
LKQARAKPSMEARVLCIPHRHAAPRKLNTSSSSGSAAAGGLELERQPCRAGDLRLDRAVDVAVGVAADHDRLDQCGTRRGTLSR